MILVLYIYLEGGRVSILSNNFGFVVSSLVTSHLVLKVGEETCLSGSAKFVDLVSEDLLVSTEIGLLDKRW